MQISFDGKFIEIAFDDNAFLASIMTALPKRRYLPKRKVWRVPRTTVIETVDYLSQYGFTPTDDVIEEYKRLKKKRLSGERLKTGKFKDSETDLLSKLNLPLYEYQKSGAGFLTAMSSALCADEPGLGKTIQSIGTVRLQKIQKALILCPLSVKRTWQEEIEKWNPGATTQVIGGTAKIRNSQWLSDANYYIANYQLLLRDFEIVSKLGFDIIICDEATIISNHQAKTTRLLKKLDIPNRIALTGTPVSNTPEDIWSVIDWISPGYLGSFTQFKDNYCIVENAIITGYKNLETLRKRIEPFMIRRLKSEVLKELPPKTYQNRWVTLSPEERKLYIALQETIRDELKVAGLVGGNVGIPTVKLIRLRQLANSAELIFDTKKSSKLEALKELLVDIIGNDEKVLIFTAFKTMADVLIRELNEYNPLLIAGPVPDDERNKNRHMFNEDDTHKILVMTSAGNVGLNLQRASVVIHYDQPWSVSAVEQREDRCHRHGQTKSVTVYNMLVEDSIDEYMYSLLQKKRGLVSEVLGDSQDSKKITVTSNDIDELLTV
jgi:SNF2 family DNA or RNA helicase